MTRVLAVVLTSVWCLSCAAGRLERVAKLSPEASGLFAQNKQFMTERQVDLFLEAQTDLERRKLVEGLKVDEMLAQFPEPQQAAIRAQAIVVGMSPAAVLLSWGAPQQRELDETQVIKGLEVERWEYKRGDRTAYVIFTNKLVSGYDDGNR